MSLKKKPDGTVKGRGCADDRKERLTIDKYSASSTMISTERLMIIASIAAKEKRVVVTVDIPGAYLQTVLTDDIVIIRFEGWMTEPLEMIDLKTYRSYVTVKKGKKVLYAELDKVLYGVPRAALLFWEQLSAHLVKGGFEINPYD